MLKLSCLAIGIIIGSLCTLGIVAYTVRRATREVVGRALW